MPRRPGAIPSACSSARIPTGPVLLPYEAAVLVDHQRARARARRSRRASGCRSSTAPARAVRFLDDQRPTPSSVLQIEALPGLPADRIPGYMPSPRRPPAQQLDAQHLRAMPPEDARAELQQLPGIGPSDSSLIVIRPAASDAQSLESPGRAAIQAAYGIDHELSDAELLALADTWRPFRTWSFGHDAGSRCLAARASRIESAVVVARRENASAGFSSVRRRPISTLVASGSRHNEAVPEGDTVWRACQRLNEVLAGRVLTRSEFRVPSWRQPI